MRAPGGTLVETDACPELAALVGAERGARGHLVPVPSPPVARRSAAREALIIAAQLGALFLVDRAGYAAASLLRLPLPGNLVGMLLLLGLLWTGVVRLEWVQAAATLLTRHLAFFFIPITVGLMGFTQVFVDRGVAIVATLVLSAALGIALAGLSAQSLGRSREERS
jgi:holin-like protein